MTKDKSQWTSDEVAGCIAAAVMAFVVLVVLTFWSFVGWLVYLLVTWATSK